jgi:hypothetical protein
VQRRERLDVQSSRPRHRLHLRPDPLARAAKPARHLGKQTVPSRSWANTPDRRAHRVKHIVLTLDGPGDQHRPRSSDARGVQSRPKGDSMQALIVHGHELKLEAVPDPEI